MKRQNKFNAGQAEFGFFNAVAVVRRAVVCHLRRFRAETIKADGTVEGGELRQVSYEAWLEWFTPLSHS
jgi:hypothetical protein